MKRHSLKTRLNRHVRISIEAITRPFFQNRAQRSAPPKLRSGARTWQRHRIVFRFVRLYFVSLIFVLVDVRIFVCHGFRCRSAMRRQNRFRQNMLAIQDDPPNFSFENNNVRCRCHALKVHLREERCHAVEAHELPCSDLGLCYMMCLCCGFLTLADFVCPAV